MRERMSNDAGSSHISRGEKKEDEKMSGMNE